MRKPAKPPRFRPHHYGELIARWREVARQSGTRLRKFACADGFDLFYLRTPALDRQHGLYISAGIHGDEAGATEGLIEWAENRGAKLGALPLLIFPCLNPWGLRNNIRLDAGGRDLNRSFHRDDLPQIAGLRKLLQGHHFDAAIMLHEDYDGEGFYLYEIQRCDPHWGEKLLHAAEREIVLDPRARIDRYRAHGSLIRRKFEQRRFERIGYPEAIWLHLYHSQRTFTVETPSEFALADRVAAHAAVLDELVRLCR